MTKRKPRAAPDTLYAFWPYDLYPYMLGAVVDETRPYTGTTKPKYSLPFVYVPSYQGFFAPFALIRGADGAQLAADLEALRDGHRTAIRETNEHWNRQLMQRLYRARIVHPKLRVK